MKSHSPRSLIQTSPDSIRQWQWEEAVNTLRRTVSESAIRFHWSMTGVPAVDATARAHLAEWQALDVADDEGGNSNYVVEALVHRALSDQHWDLYVVERGDGPTTVVRRLRDHRGFHVQWLEGRCPPTKGTTVAMRLVELDPPGLWASTLPLVFDGQPGAGGLVSALLRSFGANDVRQWSTFMRGAGARILVEYALAGLRQRAATDGAGRHVDDPETRRAA